MVMELTQHVYVFNRVLHTQLLYVFRVDLKYFVLIVTGLLEVIAQELLDLAF
jgi:hypothetical protein